MDISDVFYKTYDLFELRYFVAFYEKNILSVGLPPRMIIDTYYAAKRTIKDIEDDENGEGLRKDN